jgi:hypothetical protein
MRYRLSVLNVCSALFVVGCILFTIRNNEELVKEEGWGIVAMTSLIAIGIAGFVVDALLQWIFRDKLILAALESVIVITMALLIWIG